MVVECPETKAGGLDTPEWICIGDRDVKLRLKAGIIGGPSSSSASQSVGKLFQSCWRSRLAAARDLARSVPPSLPHRAPGVKETIGLSRESTIPLTSLSHKLQVHSLW